MTRLLPKSLLGQVLLAIGATLFLVQGVNSVLAWRIESERRETELINTLAFRFVANANRERGIEEGSRPPRRGGGRFSRGEWNSAERFPGRPTDRTRPQWARRLGETLRENGRDFAELRVIERSVADDPRAARRIERRALRRGVPESEWPHSVAIAGLRDGANWEIVRADVPPPDTRFGPAVPLIRAAVLTLLLSLVLWLVLRRITRPLAELTRRTERFAARPDPGEPIAPSGPQDVRRLIVAHNAMQARIAAMLDEKDVMLGAIGHDLKTPLAALRVRIESVADPAARARMAEGIEDITHTLDDILALARVGRADAAPERTDIAALAAGVVEEFEDMGEPVVLLQGPRIAAPIHQTWLKRGLRNLVTNALRYGGAARVSVLRDGSMAVLRVEDDGPGIPPDRIAAMVEPFTRGEASRNRATGGAGLGLTLARAVADHHGGALVLENRAEGGLRAEIRVPL